MKRPSKDFLIVMGLICAAVIAVVIANGFQEPRFSHTKTGYVYRDLHDIKMAINAYQVQFNSNPPLPLNKFYAALKGENKNEIRLLLSGKYEDSESGLRCDAWNTPYEVYLNSEGWLIRSAGPNRKFDDVEKQNEESTSDDITVFLPHIIEYKAQHDGVE